MIISPMPTSLQATISDKQRKKYNPFNEQNAGCYIGLQDIAKTLYASLPEESDRFSVNNPHAEELLTNGIRLKAIPHELAHLIFQHLFANNINPPIRISCINYTFEVAMLKTIWQQTKYLTPVLKQEAWLEMIMVYLAGPAMDELLQPQISDLNYAGEILDFVSVYLLLNKLNYKINTLQKVSSSTWNKPDDLPYLEQIVLSNTIAQDPLVAELLAGIKTSLAKVPRKVWQSGYDKMLKTGEICGKDSGLGLTEIENGLMC